ncbi:hypothetical protein OGCDGJMD_01220 [Cyanobium usitatum str. Tous]|nr:hypothetical protein OGCDGJMD_01220 [Cyanobium usitatum str. Tous]
MDRLAVAAQALTEKRLSAAEAADPNLGRAMALGRAGYEEAIRSIGSYGTASGRGAPALFTEQHQDLLQLACFQMALHLMRPSKRSMELLSEVFPASQQSLRKWVPRPVIDLPCGYGKTEAAKGVLVTSIQMHQLGRLSGGDYPGALFLADDLAQLDSVAGALAEQGLVHGVDFGMYYKPDQTTADIVTRPIAEADCPRMPILLICVQQLKARTKKERHHRDLDPVAGANQVLFMANGQQRKLVIKDECLLGIETHYFDLKELELTHDNLVKHGAVAHKAIYAPLRESVANCLIAVRAVAETLQESGATGIAELPPMDESTGALADAAAEDLSGSDVPHRILKSISQIGGLADLRVAVQFPTRRDKSNPDRLLICKAVKTWPYDRVPEFVTLDANYRVDLLTQSIQQYERSSLLELLKCQPEALKQMHPLKVHISPGLKWGKGQGGRTDLANQRTRAAYINLIVRTLLPLYRDTPRRALIFTFKDTKAVFYRDELKAALIAAGVSGDHIHYGSKGIQPHHRVVLETWGLHTSTNAFVDCTAVFFLGIMRYEPERLMYDCWGAFGKDNLSLGDLPWPVVELDRSMLICHVIQALLRSAARVTVDGRCLPCDAYMVMRDPGGNEIALERGMRKLLGDFTLLPWGTAMTKTQLTGTIPELIVQEVAALMEEEGRDRVSFSEVRSRVMASVGAKSGNTWAKYRREADKQLLAQGIKRNAEGKAAKGWLRSP